MHNLVREIEEISDQLCKAIDGNFDFVVTVYSENILTQKMSMLINFLLDSARRALETLKQHNIELKELEVRKSDFLANISHELRTPLALILGPVQELINNSRDYPGKDIENLHMIQRNASRLFALVNDLLDINKIEAKNFTVIKEPILLKKFTHDLFNDLAELAKRKEITLTADVQIKDDAFYCLDKMMFEKIIINLASNAIKFTHRNGHIIIKLLEENHLLKLTVDDNGIGIPEDKMQDLFKRFYQVDTSTSRSYSGTGIGLSLVKEFVTLMEGQVTVERLTKGTRFTVELPAEIPKNLDKDKLAIDSKTSFDSDLVPYVLTGESITVNKKINILGTTPNRPTIVIAEDNNDLLAFMKQILQDKYNLITVGNGEQVLKVLEEYDVSLILSDLMMPKLDGMQLTRLTKADPRYKYIPVILMTAKSDITTLMHGFSSGADDFLAKPFNSDELKARIYSALRIHNIYIELKDKTSEIQNLLLETKELNSRLIKVSREAGIAEVASSILHNVGNVLNGVNISAQIITNNVNKINVERFEKILNTEKQENNAALIMEYTSIMINQLKKIKEETLNELVLFNNNITHIKAIIDSQQKNARRILTSEEVNINNIIDEILLINSDEIDSQQIKIVKNYMQYIPIITTDKQNLIVVLNNLIINAIESIVERHERDNSITDKKLMITTASVGDGVSVEVLDNGVGFNDEQRNNLFRFGFTTKASGNGFGLHSCADIIKLLGGYIQADSEGVNRGAVFRISLPTEIKSHDIQ